METVHLNKRSGPPGGGGGGFLWGGGFLGGGGGKSPGPPRPPGPPRGGGGSLLLSRVSLFARLGRKLARLQQSPASRREVEDVEDQVVAGDALGVGLQAQVAVIGGQSGQGFHALRRGFSIPRPPRPPTKKTGRRPRPKTGAAPVCAVASFLFEEGCHSAGLDTTFH